MNEKFMPKVLAHWPGRNMCSGNVYDKNNVCQSLMAYMGTGGNNQPLISVEKDIGDKDMDAIKTEKTQEELDDFVENLTKPKYAIRKLTPLECFRLQNFSDEDFYKAASVNSNSQLYKQCGNSITVAVLCAIFSQLSIQGHKPWNSMSLEERRNLVYKGTILEGGEKCKNEN